MKRTIEKRAEDILDNLLADAHLGSYVSNLRIPRVHQGSEGVWLIILGQDPTTRSFSSRAPTRTVLGLDRQGNLRRLGTRRHPARVRDELPQELLREATDRNQGD